MFRLVRFFQISSTIRLTSIIFCSSSSSSSVDILHRCSTCSKVFRLPNALKHHIQTKHGGEAMAQQVNSKGECVTQKENLEEALKQKSSSETVESNGISKYSKSETIQSVTNTTVESREKTQTTLEASVAVELFTCTVCQKSFRLEAALHHHYQAKHSMEPPSTTETTQASRTIQHQHKSLGSSIGLSPVRSSLGAAVAAAVASSSSATTMESSQQSSYTFTPGESLTLQPLSSSHHHLNLVPTAPEESQLAVHSRCINTVTLVGICHNIQIGFAFDEKVIQCLIKTNAIDCENDEASALRPGEADADWHTVRISLNTATEQTLLEELKEESRVFVSGRLRLLPQFEPTLGKYYHFPLIQVIKEQGGCVTIL